MTEQKTSELNRPDEFIITVSADLAEKVRLGIIMSDLSAHSWVIVCKKPDGTFDISATNELGGKLHPSFIETLQRKACELAGIEFVAKSVSEIKSEKPEDPGSSGSSVIQEQ